LLILKDLRTWKV